MNTKYLVISAVAVMLIVATVVAVTMTENAFADEYRKKYKSQAVSQANSCGNGDLSMNILCQNMISQIQGDGNAVNVIGVQ